MSKAIEELDFISHITINDFGLTVFEYFPKECETISLALTELEQMKARAEEVINNAKRYVTADYGYKDIRGICDYILTGEYDKEERECW